MFTSELHFRMCGDLDRNASYHSNSGPSKNEEACSNVKYQLSNVVERFTKVYVDFLE